jgi:5'-3' exonuclease
MKIAIIDWMNMIKRYLSVYSYSSNNIEEFDFGEIIDTVTFSVLNKLCDIIYEIKPDLMFICSDLGYNKRAQSINSEYKANRKRAKSLTQEEKEKNYVEFIKNVAMTLPFPFINVNNVEADMIIRCLVNYIQRLEEEASITIVSSDSDFIQLLDNNVSIYDWYKGKIDINNWYIKHKKHENYFNSKNYAIGKAIAGDASDNISGLSGYGWKKVTKLFDILAENYGNNIIVSSIDELIDYINNIKDKIEDKNTFKFVNTMCADIIKNKNQLKDNLDIIDLNCIETPYVYKIYNEIERNTFDNPLKFNKSKLLEYMQLGRYGQEE